MLSNPLSLVSRREFIKLSGLSLLNLLLPSSKLHAEEILPSFGRILEDNSAIRTDPNFRSPVVRRYWQDTVLPIQGHVVGDANAGHNQSWYQVPNGYLHAAQVQPVEIQFNPAVQGLPSYGQLAEISVPFTDAFQAPDQESAIIYRYYYQTTHWVNHLEINPNGNAWYQVLDDKYDRQNYFVNADHVRIIPPEELSPLSPDFPADEKRIEVRIAEQMMIAYEGSNPVLITQVSTGDQESNPYWITPLGEHTTDYKRPSRHMAAGNRAYGDYDLPGVPWVSYFTISGVAFHGTYWHNDFGQPRSHGCVNLPPLAAKWLFRWTTPQVPHNYQMLSSSGNGTRVIIQ